MIRKIQKISVKPQKNANNFKNNINKLSIDSSWPKHIFDKLNYRSINKWSTRKKMKRSKESKKLTKENLKSKRN